MKALLLSVVVALQVAWIGATVHRQEHLLDTGTRILLETRPVDPRDLLRGDFVTLGYDFSSLDVSRFEPAVQGIGDFGPRAEVWVELRPNGRFHELARASANRLEPAPGNVVLQGRITYFPVASGRLSGTARAAFGLERYYVREGTGQPAGKLTAAAVVEPGGHAALREVFIDDVPYAEAMRAQAR